MYRHRGRTWTFSQGGNGCNGCQKKSASGGVWRRKGIGCDILGRRQLLLEFVCRWVLDLDFWIGCLEDIALPSMSIFVALRESERQIGWKQITGRVWLQCTVSTIITLLVPYTSVQIVLISMSGFWKSIGLEECRSSHYVYLVWSAMMCNGGPWDIRDIWSYENVKNGFISLPSLFRSQKLNSIFFRKF